LFGAIFNRVLTDDIASQLGAKAAGTIAKGGQLAGLTPEKLKAMPSGVVSALLHGIAAGTSSVFFWSIFITVLIPVAAVFIRHVPLRGSRPAAKPADPATERDAEAAEFERVMSAVD